MIEGHFIVLEGIDGSGTTTQAAKLQKRFTQMGLPAHRTAEPSAGPIGAMIRQVLMGRLVMRYNQRSVPLDWKVLSLLFAADRQDHVESDILPNLGEGVNVICDRYVYSSVVYQSTSSGDDDTAKWIMALNRFVKQPDLVLYLQVDWETARQRCLNRDESAEIFEEADFQKKLAEKYEDLPKLFPETNIVTVDGNRSEAEVASQCWAEVERMRSPGAVK
jgi:dTMP kinase